MSDERTPPHNLDAEKMVLGAVLVRAAEWPVVASILRPEHFYREAHKRLFAAMGRLADQRVLIDFLTVSEELTEADLKEVGGRAYIASLTTDLPATPYTEAHAGIVREKAQQRSLAELGSNLAAAAYAEDEPAATLAEQAARSLLLASSVGTADAMRARAAVDAYMTAVVNETALAPILTHYADLDDLLGGINRAELTIVAARPSVGKSSFGLAAAMRMADAGVPVVFFSLEMRIEALASQLLAWRSGVPTQKLRRKTATDSEYTQASKTWNEMADIPLFLYDIGHTLTEVTARSRRLRELHGVQVVFVDYLQKILGGSRRRQESREAEVASISHGLKALAMDQQLAVVALSQLGRAPEERKDKRPHLSDLRESGALEQDADVAILLFRDWMTKHNDDTRGIAEAIVAKNRMGPVGTKKLYFNHDLALFGDLSLRP